MSADLAVTVPAGVQAAAEDPLLESTFHIPDRPHFMVARPRLVNKLASRSDAPVTLVVGPPGSGKTQLVASWVTTATTCPVAWVALEDDGTRAYPFWTYVIAALRRAGLDISPPRAGSGPSQPADRSFLVRLVAEVTELRQPVVLVLDGISDVSGEPWVAGLEFVLRHTGPLLRVVLIGRWDPPLPLHRYRLADRLVEIRSGELAFTREEAAALLSLHGVELSPAKLSSLLEHTEGWAAGLRLFAMALQDRRDADALVDTITGNETTIAEYFLGEVLRLQPAHVRSFLLEASILDAFTPELAEAVTGRSDARRILADLERRNAFVRPAAEYSAAYRFHRLFAELLRAQLMYEAPERLVALHHRAATWFAGQGQTAEAISHAVRAGRWDLAAGIVVEHHALGRMLIDGRAGRLGTLLRHLPDDAPGAEAAVVSAALALTDGATDHSAYHLARAQEIVNGGGYRPSDALALAGVVVDVELARLNGDDDRVLRSSTKMELALAHAPPDQLLRHPELRILLSAARGMAQSRQGAVDAAAVTLTGAAAATGAGCEHLRVDCLQHLALIEAHRGRLRHAAKLADEAIELADRCGAGPARRPVGAHVALAWVAMDRYDVDAAGHHLRVAAPRRGADRCAEAAFALVKARRLQARGELRGALTLLRDAATPAERAPAWLAREITLARARLMIAAERSGEALEVVRGLADADLPEVRVVHAAALVAAGDADGARDILLPIVGSAGLPSPVSIEAWLVLARVAAVNGEPGNTRSALGHALRDAAPESQRRAVHQVWAPLRSMLRDDGGLAEQHRVLQGSAERAARPAGTGGLVIVETLSRREMDVLQGMAAMLTTEEIGARLYVSINTVKTHVRSILRKLSASRRNEAVRRARECGLI